VKTRITELLGIEHPIFQAAMSWASSNAPLVIAVSNAGGLGVLGAGPMRPDDFANVLSEIQRGTRKPFGVNIPLNGTHAAELLQIALQKKIPVMVASQGGPREQLPRFCAIGTKWLHVVASVEHAKKAEAAGVDALVVDGMEAGGHPPPSEVTTLVLVRRVLKDVKIPVVASGGVADGAGIAALLALGADAVQLGTRFIATPEAQGVIGFKEALVAAAEDGTVISRAYSGKTMRVIRSTYTDEWEARTDELQRFPAQAVAAFSEGVFHLGGDEHTEGVDPERECYPAGQAVGGISAVTPARDIVRSLVEEAEAMLSRIGGYVAASV
jgi:enoyl-[acyl-carrier protein] reductase II